MTRNTAFQEPHCIIYGLEIVHRDPQSKAIVAVECQFCKCFGHDNIVPLEKKRQREQTEAVKMFRRPFRPENYRSHLNHAHSERWPIYQQLSSSEKQSYFQNNRNFKSTLDYCLKASLSQSSMIFEVDHNIVDEIVIKMFFHPDDHDDVAQQVISKLFQSLDDNKYQIIIKNPILFRLVQKYVSHGLSFRQIVAILTETKQELKTPLITGINATAVTTMIRIGCAISLQYLATILNKKSIWAFSLANDSSTHYGRSYFDNRVRIHLNGRIHNLHVIVMPIFERHTDQHLYDLVKSAFDILCPDWRRKLISAGSDGGSNMIGRYQGVVTRLEQEAEFEIYRTWCGLHQLDLIVEAGYKALMDGEFYQRLGQFVAHLRMQQNLQTEMRSQCPKFTTRWIAAGNICRWLLNNRNQLFQHLTQSSQVNHRPPTWWWIILAGVDALANHINHVFIKLQSRSIIVSQQAMELKSLAELIQNEVGVEGPFSEHEIFLYDENEYSISTRYAVTNMRLFNFLLDQGSFVKHIFDDIKKHHDAEMIKMTVLKTVGKFVLDLIEGISEIKVISDERYFGSPSRTGLYKCARK